MFGYQLIKKSELDEIQTDLAKVSRKLNDARSLIAEMQGRQEVTDKALQDMTQVAEDYSASIKALTEDKKGLIDKVAAADDRAKEAKETLDTLKQSIRVDVVAEMHSLYIGLRTAWEERRAKKLPPKTMAENTTAITAGIDKVNDLLETLSNLSKRDKRER
jgi:chromosome segregation ATPase